MMPESYRNFQSQNLVRLLIIHVNEMKTFTFNCSPCSACSMRWTRIAIVCDDEPPSRKMYTAAAALLCNGAAMVSVTPVTLHDNTDWRDGQPLSRIHSNEDRRSSLVEILIFCTMKKNTNYELRQERPSQQATSNVGLDGNICKNIGRCERNVKERVSANQPHQPTTTRNSFVLMYALCTCSYTWRYNVDPNPHTLYRRAHTQ